METRGIGVAWGLMDLNFLRYYTGTGSSQTFRFSSPIDYFSIDAGPLHLEQQIVLQRFAYCIQWEYADRE